MTFLNPLMLAGMAAALVPFVLHLLNQSRYRNVDWGAMMFLEGLEARQFHGTRFKQWGLLAIRTLMVALLSLAMARPVLHTRGLPPARPGRTAAVILLDRSASMSLNDNGRVRLDLAREAIFQLLSPGFRRGDDLWLVPLGERDPAILPRYAGDPQEMARLVKEVTIPSGEADVASGLREALDLLASAEAPNREIYVVCDRQKSGWRNVDESFGRDWQRRLAKLPHPPRLFVVPVGTNESDNVAIEAIEVLRPPMLLEQSSDVQIRLRNYGAVPRAAVPLIVEVGSAKRLVRQMPINLPAHGEASVVVPITLYDTGSILIGARILAPGIAADKELICSVDVMKELNILVVDGDEGEGSFQGAADFLKLALASYPTSKRTSKPLPVVRPDGWGPADLRDLQVLVLANVPALTESQADMIQQFVHGGGGLIVAPGDQTRIDNYNAQLPWLPATLQPAIAESGAGSTSIGNLDLAHPIFRFLGGKPESGAVAVRRYFPAVPRQGAGVIGSYGDGKPFLVETAAGHGRVLLMTTPIDVDWNSLPLTHLFLPFIQSAIRHVAAGPSVERMARRNIEPGMPIVADYNEPIDSRALIVNGPSGRVDAANLSISQFGTSGQVRLNQTHAPGNYRIFPKGLGDNHPTHFIVRTPVAESDLTALDDARWLWIEREMRVERIDPERRNSAISQESARSGLDLWLPLLGMAIVLSMVELSATRRWAGGSS